MIALGLSGFIECRSGAEWCRSFVPFMLHVEDTAEELRAVAEAEQKKAPAMYRRDDDDNTHHVRGGVHSPSGKSHPRCALRKLHDPIVIVRFY